MTERMYAGHVYLVATLNHMWNGLGHHADAVDDRTDGQTQIASGAVVGDVRQMRFRVERDRLIARVSARHVALAAINAEVLCVDNKSVN